MEDTSSLAVTAQETLESLVAAVSLLGNGLVLYIISGHRSLRTLTNYLMASLAAADLLVGAAGIPCMIVNNRGLPSHFTACLVVSLILYSTYSSFFQLFSI